MSNTVKDGERCCCQHEREMRTGCEDWSREPGSDDEALNWPPVGPMRPAPPDARTPDQRELDALIDRQRKAGW